MKKKLWNIFIVIYIAIAVIITICLLLYNDYNVTQVGDKTFVIVENDNTGNYKKGDLIIVNGGKKTTNGDNVFYYVETAKDYSINYGRVEEINDEIMTVNNMTIQTKYLIGSEKNASKISIVGSILSVLESKWGYLCTVILPILLLFVYEIYSILKEIKKSK